MNRYRVYINSIFDEIIASEVVHNDKGLNFYQKDELVATFIKWDYWKKIIDVKH